MKKFYFKCKNKINNKNIVISQAAKNVIEAEEIIRQQHDNIIIISFMGWCEE